MVQSHAWKQLGTAALWRYTDNTRNFPGWHFTADAAGCASLVALLDALAADAAPASRTVALVAPTAANLAVPGNRSAGIVAANRLRISYSPDLTSWQMPEDAEPAQLSIGPNWLSTLRDAIAGIPRGEGDYSVGASGSGNSQLWIWWWRQAA